ncbi:2Fe-2S iron-sulfur cluster-binding protein [Parendozoicomonas haliclonae]|uniref:Phenol hydroxylase P5 protein n=1 Tax=Parendozoicomonas haliclonae TaxID=1960125 RepID=A0A1X7ADQ7_9GAMM|nr:2Fe-2S iron-sulfur cluster binding domain-containing protein [Parendozoicomonas haliclonae]SMA32489.1 Phenol hydroxylase P5 protein [Parendozoicomonas haliclonae]
MAEIQFDGNTYHNAEGESVLDTLLRNHAQVPWSCRAGLCHSCMLQATDGLIPSAAQIGLTQEQKSDQLFLACQCYPESSLTVQPLRRALQPMQAIITRKNLLSPTLLEVTFSPRLPINYRPGQFLSLSREKEIAGSRYTLISRPWAEPDLRIHVHRKVGGDFSAWLFDEAHQGQMFWLNGLGGECCYHPDDSSAYVVVGVEQGIGAALAVADDIHWHDARVSAQIMLCGELTGHAIPDANTLTVESKKQLPEIATPLLADHKFRDARWLMFGKPKAVLGFAAWLGEQGVPRERVIPLAYRSL